MATLDDKLLGEKLHNYCSSSESEDESGSGDEGEGACKKVSTASAPDINKWEGTSTNTGPKGVIKDWQRFKQLESEKRAEAEREQIELVKKLSMTCKSTLDEEHEKAAEEDPDLAELLNDKFLLSYQKQRMQEMLSKQNASPKFGNIITLKSGDEFLDAIDKENKNVKIIIHIYEDYVPACRKMNDCLLKLCKEYPDVKCCRILSSVAGLSRHFKVSGVPALLIYKGGQLIGNFIRVSDELGDSFYYDELQSYLVEYGMLLDKECVPSVVSTPDDD